MFDSIIANLLTSTGRTALDSLAAYLLTAHYLQNVNDEKQFVAGGLWLLSRGWAWYEKYGHAQLSAKAKKAGIALTIFLCAAITLYSPTAHAQAAAKTTLVASQSATPACSIASCLNYVFIGGGIGGIGSNVDILGSGLDNSVFADGGMPFAQAEWINWNGNILFGASAGFGYQFAQPATVGAVSNSQSQPMGWLFAEVGGNLFSLFGNGVTAPASQSPLIADLMAPAALTGPVFVKGAVLWGNGAKLSYLVGNNLKFDVGYVFANSQIAGVNNVQMVLLGLEYGFKP